MSSVTKDWNSEDSTNEGSKSTEAGPSEPKNLPKDEPFTYKSPTLSPDSWGYVSASSDDEDTTKSSKARGKQPAKPLKRVLRKIAPKLTGQANSGKRVRFDPIADPLDELQQFKDKGIGIFMVISRPLQGRFYQWSISLYNRTTQQWWTTEAFQAPFNGAYNPIWNTHENDPRSLPGYVVMNFLAHVRESSLNELMEIALRIQDSAEHGQGLDSQGYVTEYGHWLKYHNHCRYEHIDEIWQLMVQYHGDQQVDVSRGDSRQKRSHNT
ncbi:hypothetical protein G7Z17_g9782 [Cylindrodendrum hubeiense]|uniref:Uncharacterized protein n=1 Tax=Cylindrodendrum hubeiense TaxID=595255 RepID=A0A9P5LDB4_9HYPO|nr:hypothetical protein G7Z17_g9782 [Cylindrodendrum hubeiense]